MELLHKVYDPDRFRQQAHQLVDIMADHLKAAQTGEQMPAIKWMPPETAAQHWQQDWEQAADSDPLELFQKVLQESVQLHHPQYMGHQISPPAPVSVLAGLVNDFLNNGMGVYEMGIPGSTLERQVILSVARQMGFGEQADGVLTSGGTLANLTGLLTARSIILGGKSWQEGTQNRGQLALMVSEHAHYCVDRAVKIMGWGEAGIIKVPVDDQYRMQTELLEDYYREHTAAGKTIIAVVGSACSTSTGSFDDLHALADFCKQHQLWLHVDGAHGAATVYSQKYRTLVAGIERANSVVMDFHKMLVTPSITTALIFKDGSHNYQTFAQKAQYLWNREDDAEWFNLAKRTFECTKTMLSLRVYSILRTYGPAFFDAYVSRVIDLGRAFGTMVDNNPDFELAVPPACNIICFRYTPKQIAFSDFNALNEQIRQALLEEGDFYIVKTVLNGDIYLRTTLTNPFTTEQHLTALLERLRTLARPYVEQLAKAPI